MTTEPAKMRRMTPRDDRRELAKLALAVLLVALILAAIIGAVSGRW